MICRKKLMVFLDPKHYFKYLLFDLCVIAYIPFQSARSESNIFLFSLIFYVTYHCTYTLIWCIMWCQLQLAFSIVMNTSDLILHSSCLLCCFSFHIHFTSFSDNVQSLFIIVWMNCKLWTFPLLSFWFLTEIAFVTYDDLGSTCH